MENSQNLSNTLNRVLKRALTSAQNHGVLHGIMLSGKLLWQLITNYLWCYGLYKPFLSDRSFFFEGKSYRYFYHPYNTAWKNERTIEIPLALEVLKTYQGTKILEVGNVLSHYDPTVYHTVLDKYEKGRGVINEDVVDFRSSGTFDLIISISTLEHVGWDEHPREPLKVLRAIENLTSLLSPSGKLFVTVPLGYNSALDSLLEENKTLFSILYCLKRVSRNNTWVQTNWDDVRETRYGNPYISANALVVGVIEKR
jgi:SAM-dependent methyltransferase